MPWEEIKGQERAVKLLQEALRRERLGHAYLFYGPPGVGKGTAARVLAQAVNCPEKPGEGCGGCRSCRRIAEGQHPDVVVLQSEGLHVRLEQVRYLLERVYFCPLEGRRKVFILRQAESLTAEAANSLLKALEEPPGDVLFVLTASSRQAVLSTVQSRCVPVEFNFLPQQVLEELIRERGWAAAGEEALLSGMAGGSAGMACSLAQKGEWQRAREDMLTVLEAIDVQADITSQFFRGEQGRDYLDLLFKVFAAWFRDIMVWQKTGRADLAVNKDRISDIQAQAARWERPEEVLFLAVKSLRQLRQNANLPLLWEVFLVKLAAHGGRNYAHSGWSAF